MHDSNIKKVADFLGNGLAFGLVCVMFGCAVGLVYVVVGVVFQ